MSFLAPLFLLGGLAIALPVVFHLVRRSSREKMVFSSLMFLKPTPPRMTRRNRLENIFLLLLRCLAICILALGFARPFLPKPMAAAPQGSAAARFILLVDTSASMKREGVWAEALTKAEAALRKTSVADQVAILAFDDQVRSVVSFEQWAAMGMAERASLAAQQLAESKPTWRATQLGNALLAAAEALEDVDRREPRPGPRRIILISDLQEGSRLDGLQGYEWPRGIEVIVESVKARRPTNAGLQWVMDAENSAQSDADAVRLRVSNSSDAQREQFTIRWDGVAGAASLDAYVPPGQSRIVPAPKIPTNAVSDRIVLGGDDDGFDNTVFLTPPKAEEVNVVFLGTESEKEPAQMLYYLKRAFQDTRRKTVRIQNDFANASGALVTNRLLILPGAFAGNRLMDIQNFANEGGTILFVMTDAASGKALGQIVGKEVNATEATLANYSMFGQLDLGHPLLAPFSDPRFSDFTKIRFWKHRKLPLDPLPGARVIASYDDNDPAIVEVPVGRGRIFVLTSSWRPADGQLALSSKFVPLLYSLLDQAGGVRAQLAQYRVGDSVELDVKPGDTPLAIRKPDGSQVQLAAGVTRFSQTDQPGIYEVATTQPPMRFAVNLDATESKTAPLPADELERLGVPLKASVSASPAPLVQQQNLHAAELEGRQKLWRVLIVAALVVLMVETWLAGWITRRSAVRIEAAA